MSNAFEWQQHIIQFVKTCNYFKGLVISSGMIQNHLLTKFGLTAAEFLRPFIQARQVRMRLGMKDRVFDDFNVTLIDREEFDSIPKDKLDKSARSILREFAPNLDNLEIAKKWNQRLSVDLMIDSNKTSWFHQNEQIVADFSSYNYHLNFLDQPLVIIYVVSGQESEVIKEVHKLKQQNEKLIKMIFANNQQDLEYVKKFILVLNDASEKQQFMQEDRVRKEFNHHFCKVLPYNQEQAIPSNIWNKFQKRKYNIPNEAIKQTISILDELSIKQYKNYFDEMMSHQVLPGLERMYNIMTQQNIEARKRPLADQLFNFLKRNDQQKPELDYQMTQREYFLRYLADLNFLLQDYDLAAEYYKALIQELKSNKTKTVIVALNAQEYFVYSRLVSEAGLDLRLSKKDKEEMFSSFEEVQQGYIIERQGAFQLRVVYFFIYAINLNQRYIKESIFQLQRSNKFFRELGQLQKPDHYIIFSTMLFEQIAFLYLRLDPPQYRKFAHNLTLVASKYESEGTKKHSLRCFKIVESIYQESKWTGILFWLESHVGANNIENERLTEGVDSFKYAWNLMTERQSIEMHSQLITDWKKAYSVFDSNKSNKSLLDKAFKDSKIELCLPQLKDPVDIICEDDIMQVCDNRLIPELNSIDAGGRPTFTSQKWVLLKREGSTYQEEFLLKSMDSDFLEQKIDCWNKSPCVINFAKVDDVVDKFNKFARVTFANEPIYLKVQMSNPVKTASTLTNLKVEYTFYSIETTTDLLQLDDKFNQKYVATQFPQSAIEIVSHTFNKPSVNFLILYDKIEFLQVSIKPPVPGYLIITGITWNFMDIPVSYPLNYDLKNQTQKKSVNFFNKFKVLPAQPILQISLQNSFEPEIYYGEIRSIVLNLKNESNEAIKSIIIRALVPYHFGFEELQLPGILEPGQQINYNIYLRCSFLENFTAKLLVYYGDSPTYHYKRLVFPVKVKNSFKIQVQSDPTIDFWKFTLAIQEYFRDRGRDGELKINRILCVNENWLPQPGTRFFVSESINEQYLMVSFNLLKKANENGQMRFQEFDRRAKKFWMNNSQNHTIDISKEQTIGIDILQNFVNEDIKHYFKLYFNFDESDINFEFPLFLVVVWSFSDKEQVINGMHEIPISMVNYQNLKKNELNDLPFALSISVPSVIDHDFDEIPYCYQDVVVKVKNTKYPFVISLKLEFFNGDDQMKSASDGAEPSFVWQGTSSVLVNALKPQEEYVIQQGVLFFQKGCYDLSHIKVTLFNEPVLNDISVTRKYDAREFYSYEMEQVYVKIQ